MCVGTYVHAPVQIWLDNLDKCFRVLKILVPQNFHQLRDLKLHFSVSSLTCSWNILEMMLISIDDKNIIQIVYFVYVE